jgi:hypothetical protein
MAWNKERHYNTGGGIYRITGTVDPEFPNHAFFDLLNMVYDRESDNPETMRGATRLGTTDMGGVVTGLWDYNNGDKLVASVTDGKFYEYSGTDWAAGGTGARKDSNSTTATKRWAGSMFYGATTTKNLLVVANDDDADDPVKYDTTNGWVTLGGSPPLNGKFPVAWQNRLWMFDDDTAYYSVIGDCEDWTANNGGGNMTIYRGFDGDITGAAAFANNLFIFKRSSIYRIAPTATFSAINVRNVSSRIGCVSHHTASQSGNKLFFMSEHGIETVTASNISSGFYIDDSYSRWVKPIIDTKNDTHLDKSWGMFNTDRLEYMVQFPTSNKTVPSVGLIANTSQKKQRWTRMNQVGLTAGVVFNDSNVSYHHLVADDNGRVYRMFDIDTAKWDDSIIMSRVQTKFYTLDAPEIMKRYGWSFIQVDKEGTYSVFVKQIMLRQRKMTTPATANLADLTIVGSSGWGVGQWGVALWGGTGNAGERVRPDVLARGTGMQVLVESNEWFRYKGNVIASVLRSDRTAA